MAGIAVERINGDLVRQIITDKGLDSIRPRDINLQGLGKVERIVVVGSSCVGKSTIEGFTREAVREDAALQAKVDVPRRVVTRAKRPDDKDDVYHAGAEELERMRVSGDLGLYGVKTMEGGRIEPYGYVNPAEGRFPVYFANNQTLRNPECIEPTGFLDNALVALIYTPDDIREERLMERSPALFVEKPEEVAFRLSDIERSVRLADRAHLIIKNWGSNMKRAPQDVAVLIRELVMFAS